MASSVPLLLCLQTVAILCSGVLQQVDGTTDDAVAMKIAFSQESHHLIVQKKSHVLLNCSVTAPPDSGKLRFEWYKGRTQLNVKNFRPWIRLYQNGSLYIRRAKPQHEGIYRCFVRNNIGRVIVRNVRLELASMAKNFSIQPLPRDGYVGGVARFECSINTVPPPIFTWQKDSQSLPQEENK
ncbi:immunoglobulin superfamily DCC subclass member 3-like [Gigantopelta aegis]|uniref:immunoglobulin superfamily DCC subclass member 3-like n=1 Tax=Gigantopelta aegis TaxID=1735272 RepID=UPI001B88C8C7|nr:immunoglobulin superfamily DCC subclass member 3-like [Gigantopelta aegis]